MTDTLKMQDIFSLNTVIDSMKDSVSKGYNFESRPDKLETSINLYFADNFVDADTMSRYSKFNEDVRKLMFEMITELEERRDSMMLRVMSNFHNKGETDE